MAPYTFESTTRRSIVERKGKYATVSGRQEGSSIVINPPLGIEKFDSSHDIDTKNCVTDRVSYCLRVPFGHRCAHTKICSNSEH